MQPLCLYKPPNLPSPDQQVFGGLGMAIFNSSELIVDHFKGGNQQSVKLEEEMDTNDEMDLIIE
jgi:hypothetical protein